MDKEISGQKFMEELELFQAVMIWANNPDNIDLHIVAHEVTQCYGGPEEGGWWYHAGEPVESVVIRTCFHPWLPGKCDCGYVDNGYDDEDHQDDEEHICNYFNDSPSTMEFATVLEKAFPSFLRIQKVYNELEKKWLPEKSKCAFHSASSRGYKHEVSIQLDSEGYPKQRPYYS